MTKKGGGRLKVGGKRRAVEKKGLLTREIKKEVGNKRKTLMEMNNGGRKTRGKKALWGGRKGRMKKGDRDKGCGDWRGEG